VTPTALHGWDTLTTGQSVEAIPLRAPGTVKPSQVDGRRVGVVPLSPMVATRPRKLVRPCWIYALTNAMGQVIYVGKSFQPRTRARSHERYWLGAVGFKVLEVVAPGEDYREHEQWWVRHIEARGEPLVNIYLRRRKASA
jgi:hypothetical protein